MTSLPIIVTDAGRAAIVNASAPGTNTVKIAQVGLSASAISPSPSTASLPNEIKRLSSISGMATDATTVHLTVRDDSTDVYELRSFAIYLSDGTLFGIYSGANLLMEKAAPAMLLLAIDISFSDINAASITFGDTNFVNPAATTETQGVVELATIAEAKAGTDNSRAVTPAGVKAVADTKASATHNHAIADILELATALAAKLNASGYTAADVLAKLLTVDGAGSGLDADMLDGLEGSAYAKLAGANFSGSINVTGLDASVVARSDGVGPNWYGRIISSNVTGDCAIFLGTFNSKSVVAAHNYALNAWKDLYINTPDGLGGGTIRMAPVVYIGGNLAWHSGNDGAGSGLDADMLDGLDGSAYAKLSGAWFTGGVGVGGYSYDGNTISVGDGQYGLSAAGGNLVVRGASNIQFRNSSGVIGFIDSGGNFSASGGMTAAGNTVWNAGNDGAGSGLDADTVCGSPLKALLRSSAIWLDGQDCNSFTGESTQNVMFTVNLEKSANAPPRAYNWGTFLNLAQIDGNSRTQIFISHTGNDFCFRGGWGNAFTGWNRTWTQANDGAGSGLDADTVDGKHLSEIVPVAGSQSIGANTHPEATDDWSGDYKRSIITGTAFVTFCGAWGTGQGPYYAQLYVDGAPYPGAWSVIGALSGSDYVVCNAHISTTVTGLSNGEHTFSVKYTKAADLALYNRGTLSVIQTS